MDLLKDDIKKVYFKYLTAAFGSALITSIYSIVDMAMVGQYHGPDGSAALAIVAPIWNIVCSLGLLTGIGGSVLFSNLRGHGQGNEKRSNEYFTMSVLLSIVLSAAVWIMLVFFDRPLFQAFGAEGAVLDIALNYIMPIKYVCPLFLLNIMIAFSLSIFPPHCYMIRNAVFWIPVSRASLSAVIFSPAGKCPIYSFT